MKTFIKKCSITLICLTLILCCTLNSFAYIECDGNVNAYEWEGTEQVILFEGFGHSGCCYHSACVKFKYIEEDRRVYLAVFLENSNSDLSKTPEDTSNEIYFSFNNSSRLTLRSNLTSDYNEDEFFLNYGYFADSFGGGTYEAEIVLKELEYDETITVNFSVKDYNSDTSQTYKIVIKSEELKEEESESISAAEKEKEKAAKTTKEKTTKKSSSRTTKKRTTTKKETTTEFITAVLTEDYETYSETMEKNSNSILIIGVACVVTSVAAMCVAMFKKDKQ